MPVDGAIAADKDDSGDSLEKLVADLALIHSRHPASPAPQCIHLNGRRRESEV
jgi:hypothetical protein